MTPIAKQPELTSEEIDESISKQNQNLQAEAIARAEARAAAAGEKPLTREEIRAARQPILNQYVVDNTTPDGLPIVDEASADEEESGEEASGELDPAEELAAAQEEYKRIFGRPANARWNVKQIQSRIDEAK